ncbi:hypothetical protein T10_7856 [Trichinella papuae]|uniref:Uncharacterized protein n=1 Tax=Trichinella papuae TaxID=268474 RepID=A0A0V1N0Q0_9BILA|nr:hypothetical protein T10_7856 [Trichinella papuae]
MNFHLTINGSSSMIYFKALFTPLSMQTNIAFLTCSSSGNCDSASAESRARVLSSCLSPCRRHSTTFRQNSKCVRDLRLALQWIRHAATVATFKTFTKSGQYYFFLQILFPNVCLTDFKYSSQMLMTTDREDQCLPYQSLLWTSIRRLNLCNGLCVCQLLATVTTELSSHLATAVSDNIDAVAPAARLCRTVPVARMPRPGVPWKPVDPFLDHIVGVAVISAEHPDLITEANKLPPDKHLRTMATEHATEWRYLTHYVVFGSSCSLCLTQGEHPYPAALTSSVGHGEADSSPTLLIWSFEGTSVDRRHRSNLSDFFHEGVAARAFLDVRCLGIYSSTSNSPAGSNSSSGSSGTYSVSLTSSLESPAVEGRTMTLTGYTEDRVAALVETVGGSRNGEKAFTSRAEAFERCDPSSPDTTGESLVSNSGQMCPEQLGAQYVEARNVQVTLEYTLPDEDALEAVL